MDDALGGNRSGGMKIRDFLELIRLPGMFTAHADILAAFLVAGAGFNEIFSLFWLILATSCFFSAGMALNDFFDADVDARERPARPIPSGRVARSQALAIGLTLLAVGTSAAWMAGIRPFFISLILVLTILVYDGLLKETLAGPLFMASCRYLNFLMGLAILPFKGWTLVPLITGLYILGVTILSRKEAQGGGAALNIGGCTLCLGLSSSIYYLFYLNQILMHFSGVLMILGFGLVQSRKVLVLLEKNDPADFQQVMKILLLSIILLDFIIVWGARFSWAAFLIPALYLPAVLSVRLFRVT